MMMMMMTTMAQPEIHIAACTTRHYTRDFGYLHDFARMVALSNEVLPIAGRNYDANGKLTDLKVTMTEYDSLLSGGEANKVLAEIAMVANPTPNIVLGCLASSESQGAAPLAGRLGMAMISWSSTSTQLSNTALYPTFFRSCTPDDAQARALKGIFDKYGYSQFNLLFSSESYPSSLAGNIRDVMAEDNIVMSPETELQFPDYGGQGVTQTEKDTMWTDGVNRLIRMENRIWFMVLDISLFTMFLEFLITVFGESLVYNRYVFMLPEGANPIFTSVQWPATVAASGVSAPFVGAFVTRPLAAADVKTKLEDFYKGLTPADFSDFSKATGANGENLFTHTTTTYLEEDNVPAGISGVTGITIPTITQKMLTTLRGGAGLDDYTYSAVDAMQAIVRATLELLDAGHNIADIKGDLLLSSMRNTTFSGAQGNVEFDANGDAYGAYEIAQVWEDAALNVVGTWSKVSGVTFSATPKFKGGTTTVPGDRPLSCPDFQKANPLTETCEPCALGFGGKTCDPCAAGWKGAVDAATGQNVCQGCAPGTFNTAEGLLACESCDAGYYSTAGSTSCQPCTILGTGTVGANRECEPCPQGTYSLNGVCTACAASDAPEELTTISTGAHSVDNCVCRRGYFYHPRTNTCKKRQKNSFCPPGKGIPFVEKGYAARVLVTAGSEGAEAPCIFAECGEMYKGQALAPIEDLAYSSGALAPADFEGLAIWFCQRPGLCPEDPNAVYELAGPLRPAQECVDGRAELVKGNIPCTKCAEGRYIEDEGCYDCGASGSFAPLLVVAVLVMLIVVFKLSYSPKITTA